MGQIYMINGYRKSWWVARHLKECVANLSVYLPGIVYRTYYIETVADFPAGLHHFLHLLLGEFPFPLLFEGFSSGSTLRAFLRGKQSNSDKTAFSAFPALRYH